MARRLVLPAALALITIMALAAPAGAHVDIDPGEAVAGSITTVTLTFSHGRDGAPTTRLEVKVPEGARIVEVPEVAGWTSEVDVAAGVVTWSGGPVPDGEQAALPLVVRMPASVGEVLFPAVQTTEAGELAWIAEDGGEGEDSSPAPRITLVAAPNAAATTTTTAATTTTTGDLPGTVLEAEERDDGEQSVAPWVIGSGIAALIAIGVGGTVLKRRMG